MKLDDFKKLTAKEQTSELQRVTKKYGKKIPYTGSKIVKEGRYNTALTDFPDLEVCHRNLQDLQLSHTGQNDVEKPQEDELESLKPDDSILKSLLVPDTARVLPSTAICLQILDYPTEYEIAEDYQDAEDSMSAVVTLVQVRTNISSKPSWI
jgi:hypothetical protein